MNKTVKRILIAVGILFLLSQGMEWWVEYRFQRIINRKPDRAYDIQYKNFDVHSFFKGVTLEEVGIVPVSIDSGATVIRGTVSYAQLTGMKWYELAFARRLNINSILFERPMFKVTLSSHPKKKTSGKGFQVLFGDIISRANLKSFELQKGSVILMSPDEQTIRGSLSNLNVKANEIKTDSVIWNSIIPFELGSLESSIDSLSFQMNDYTHLSTGSISFKKRENKLTLRDVNMLYTEDLSKVSQRVGKQTDLIEVSLGELAFEQLTASSNLYTDLDIETKKMLLRDLVFKDYRDKNMERPPDTVKPMFKGMVDAIPITLSVDTIQLDNVEVQYSELGVGKEAPATLRFESINGFITHLTTIPQKQEAYKSFEANLEANLNGAAPFTFILEVPYDRDAFTAVASFGSFDLTGLSETTRNMAGIEIVSGDVKKIHFEMRAVETYSHNKMQFDYENLKVHVIKENKQHEVKNHPLVSAIANSALRTHNVPTHGKYVQADYQSRRNVYRSPFNLMSHSLADGMMHIVPGSFVQSILGVNKDSKKAKKEKKHDKKQRKN
jgi:hypothetical protein